MIELNNIFIKMYITLARKEYIIENILSIEDNLKMKDYICKFDQDIYNSIKNYNEKIDFKSKLKLSSSNKQGRYHLNKSKTFENTSNLKSKDIKKISSDLKMNCLSETDKTISSNFNFISNSLEKDSFKSTEISSNNSNSTYFNNSSLTNSVIDDEKENLSLKKNSLFLKPDKINRTDLDKISQNSNVDENFIYIGNNSYNDINDNSQIEDIINLIDYNILDDQKYFSLEKERQLSIDDFELLSYIGRGGYGYVNLYKKKDTGDIFAIKIMNKSKFSNKRTSNMLMRETEILNEINNEFLVRCFYIFSDIDNYYFVMEYVAGGDLEHFIQNAAYGPEIIKILCVEILTALEYLHSKGIIHKDIKPENVLISSSGHFKLADFGLSDFTKRNMINKENNEVIINLDSGQDSISNYNNIDNKNERIIITGTPNYTAPEIIQGKEITHAVDIWALGVMLFEMYTYKQPFNSDKYEKIYENIINLSIDWNLLEQSLGGDKNAFDLIKNFLILEPEHRLTNYYKIKHHPYFFDIDWNNIKLIDNRYIRGYAIKQIKSFKTKKFEEIDLIYTNSTSRSNTENINYTLLSERVDNLHIINIREWKKKTFLELNEKDLYDYISDMQI